MLRDEAVLSMRMSATRTSSPRAEPQASQDPVAAARSTSRLGADPLDLLA